MRIDTFRLTKKIINPDYSENYSQLSGEVKEVLRYDGGVEIARLKSNNYLLIIDREEYKGKIEKLEEILFEWYKNNVLEEYDFLPEHVKKILDTYDDEKDLYKECARISKELAKINYSCEYYLDGVIYNIKPVEKN